MEREVEHPQVNRKFKLFSNVLVLALLIPKVRKSLKRAVMSIDFKKLQPNNQDWFWMNLRGGYNYFGKTEKERLKDISHLKVAEKVRISDFIK